MSRSAARLILYEAIRRRVEEMDLIGIDRKPDHVTSLDPVAPRFDDRPGGYTRIIKRHGRSLGDGGHNAFFELLKEGETKHRNRQIASTPAPAPKVEGEGEKK